MIEEFVLTWSPPHEGLDVGIDLFEIDGIDLTQINDLGEQKRQVADPDHLPYDPRMGF